MYISLVLLLTFLLRIIPKINTTSIAPDSYFHLFLKNTIADAQQTPANIDRILINNELNYPYGFHWFLSFIPKRFDLMVDKYTSAFLDTLYVLFTYLFCLYITESSLISLYSAIFISISSVFLRVSNGPRAYNLTPRVFGELLTLIYFIALLLYFHTQSIAFLAIASIIIPFIIISSKFSFQVILFFTISFVFLGNIDLLLTLAVSLGVGFIIFRKSLFSILIAHYEHSIFYYKYNQQKYLWPNIISLKGYKNLFLKKLKSKEFTLWLYQENSLYHQLLFIHWPIFVILYFSLFSDLTSKFDNEYFYLLLCSFILSLLINFKPLLFLGEAERYVEYTLFIQAIVFSYICVEFNMEFLFYIFCLQSILGYFYYIKIFKRYNSHNGLLLEDIKKISHIVDTADNKVLPLGGIHWSLLYHSTKLKIVMVLQNNEKKYSYEKWYKILGNYPFPGVPIKELYEEIPFEYILIPQNKIKIYEERLNDPVFNTSDVEIIYEGEYLNLYKLTRNTIENSTM